MQTQEYDYLIIGAGIVGLTLALELKKAKPQARILIIDKENDAAAHASGRNSGVLHAGFYYTADSLKARFTVEGNKRMREYCKSHALPINECGKLVVATNEAEHEQLFELERRGKRNGSTIEIISEQQAEAIEPNIKTFKNALWSPLTATIDPLAVCRALKEDLAKAGVEMKFSTSFVRKDGDDVVLSSGEKLKCHVVNCAGLYADKISREFGFGKHYTIIPFKGLYLKYAKNKTDIATNIYPVPNLKNPFLGVHFTKTVDGTIKIGPTAIPAWWRENYSLKERFSLTEAADILFHEAKLFLLNSFNFRSLAFEEMRKYQKSFFVGLATKLVKHIDVNGFGEYTRPGIRAQLLDKRTNSLVQDFVVEGDSKSTHILNAVSPGFTCSFPFANYIIEKYLAAR